MASMNDQQFQTIFTLIQDFKSDMNRRFEQVDSQIKDVKHEIRDIKQDMKIDRVKIQEVYDSRNKVRVDFTRNWVFASLFIAIVSSSFVLTMSRIV
jgi:hypothetical protein